MRYSGSWMTIWDDRILEVARQEEHITASELDKSNLIHVGRSQISRRLGVLYDHGLLQKLPNGVYVISEVGEAYLDGEYDVENERWLDGNDAASDSGTDTGVEGANGGG